MASGHVKTTTTLVTEDKQEPVRCIAYALENKGTSIVIINDVIDILPGQSRSWHVVPGCIYYDTLNVKFTGGGVNRLLIIKAVENNINNGEVK